MIPRPDFYPAEPTELPGPDLFMTVIKARDWERLAGWYAETLGLLAVLRDAEHRFVLLAAGSGRLAIQGDPEASVTQGPDRTRLVFLVPDVDAERARLESGGLAIELARENSREGYREIRLSDPEGTPLTLFSWTTRKRAAGLDQPPE